MDLSVVGPLSAACMYMICVGVRDLAKMSLFSIIIFKVLYHSIIFGVD